MNRTRAAAVASDALRISQVGRYTNLPGETIDISAGVRSAIASTIEYSPQMLLPKWTASGVQTRVEVATMPIIKNPDSTTIFPLRW